MEKKEKSVAAIMPPPPLHIVGDGFRVHNFFPSDPSIGIDGMSPFFLLDYGSKHYFPPSEKPRGVDVHPHRGFETVTIAYHGSIAHHDSAGNSGVINEGDVQWMTAASGILHKEYHDTEFSKKGGLFQMVQLWVNLPARFKMIPPGYQAIKKEDIVQYKLDDGKSSVGIIAGEYNSLTGPASTFTPVNLFTVNLFTAGSAIFNFPEKYNTGILVIEGELKINNEYFAPENHFVKFANKGEFIRTEAVNDSTFLVMSGEPINEPMASHGPFLMNTEQEIRQAYDDFRKGKFGYLTE
jgi:redox-sensitive bicupin YhaK (pirin superfamily)